MVDLSIVTSMLVTIPHDPLAEVPCRSWQGERDKKTSGMSPHRTGAHKLPKWPDHSPGNVTHVWCFKAPFSMAKSTKNNMLRTLDAESRSVLSAYVNFHRWGPHFQSSFKDESHLWLIRPLGTPLCNLRSKHSRDGRNGWNHGISTWSHTVNLDAGHCQTSTCIACSEVL